MIVVLSLLLVVCFGFVFFSWNLARRRVIVKLIFICIIKLFWFYRLQIKGHKDIYGLGICMQYRVRNDYVPGQYFSS